MLVGRVHEDRVAGLLGAEDEHVVLVGADDDLVDPDVRRLVVRGAGGRGSRSGYGTGIDGCTGRRRLRDQTGAGRDGNWTGRSSTVDPALWTSVTLPPRQRSATRCAPGCPSTWSGSSPRSAPAAVRPTRPATTSASSGSACSGRTAGSGMSWPKEYGGRDAGIVEQVIFNEEYAKAGAPARISFFGEGLFAPTLIAYGTEEQKQRFLPEDPGRRGAVVPGVLGAERGLGPLERPDPRGARRRRVGDQRPEGLDHAGAPRGLVLLHLPHRSRRARAQGPVVRA